MTVTSIDIMEIHKTNKHMFHLLHLTHKSILNEYIYKKNFTLIWTLSVQFA